MGYFRICWLDDLNPVAQICHYTVKAAIDKMWGRKKVCDCVSIKLYFQKNQGTFSCKQTVLCHSRFRDYLYNVLLRNLGSVSLWDKRRKENKYSLHTDKEPCAQIPFQIETRRNGVTASSKRAK